MYFNEIKKGMNLPETVNIFDTTLRDGEQTPGVAITVDEKIKVAQKLDDLGVGTIEFGFPASSKGEMETAKALQNLNLDADLCGLARTVKSDIDYVIDSGIDYVHTFIGTSFYHREHKLKMTKEEIIERTVDSIEYAKDHGLFVEFSCEDATRTEFDYLLEVYKAAEDAKADIFNVPDTVGVTIPSAMGNLISKLKTNLKTPLSVHCHDDYGLSLANSLIAVENGAEQVHVTVNGLGERAGNTPLEELVMVLINIYGYDLGIKTEEIFNLSEFVSKITGIRTPPNKAIIGENAFAHESGIHVQAVLNDAATYEAMNPEIVGRDRKIVIGKHTGKNAVKSKLDEFGFELNDEQFRELFSTIKELGDKGKCITDADFKSLVITMLTKAQKQRVKLLGFSVMTGVGFSPTATVKLQIDDEIRETSKIGVGPVDASLLAIQDLVQDYSNIELEDYSINSITSGTDALADVFVSTYDDKGNTASGIATSDDVVMASVEAVLDSVNKLLMIDDYSSKN